MKQRPIGPLVEALREIGADIEYLENKGYPPLQIGYVAQQKKNKIALRSDISSQFISALCMIAPNLPKGLEIVLLGETVSQPYLDMTLNLMKKFGIKVVHEESIIKIEKQNYKSVPYKVESDWSSASYFFAIASIAPTAEIELTSFSEDSLQGDSVIEELSKWFEVQSQYDGDKLIIKSGDKKATDIEYDFIKQPDLAQTVAVMCAANNIEGRFLGLKTLKIKETDRVEALRKELDQIGVAFERRSDYGGYMLEGKTSMELPRFETYNDHRMAMSLASLALLAPIEIKNPKVVTKSYPNFWNDLQLLGFHVELV